MGRWARREGQASVRNRIALSIATVGGLGRLPAPGTWGSLAGLCVGFLMLDHFTTRWRCVVLVGMFLLSVLACTWAEQRLGQQDPPEIILDEVWAMVVVVVGLAEIARVPRPAFWSFAAFRFFDIVKPPPLRRLARLPAGWGIMADDAGAALYTLLLCWIVR